jgi:hypothetical protein
MLSGGSKVAFVPPISVRTDGLTVELSCRRMDAGRMGDVHSQYPQFIVAALGEAP